MNELANKTVTELHGLMESGEATPSEITKAVADRIASQEPVIQAYVTTLSEEAQKQAQADDETVKKDGLTGMLDAIPYALKDNMCTDGILTTCSSKILSNFVPPYNCTVYDKLQDKGGILMGKTNMDEFAMGSSCETSALRDTKNPWNIEYVPGGSSGGSAAAVASGMAPYALGSDTGGSIRQPAACCGVVGLKPTYGLVSRYGLVAFASSLDQIGTFTKDVEDCAIVMDAIAGHDKRDSTSVPDRKIDFTGDLKSGVKGMKIGISKAFMGEGLQDEIRNSIDEACHVYKELGAEIVDVDFTMLDYALPAYYLIASAEASSNLARYDGIRYGVRAEDTGGLVDLYVKTRTEGFGDEVKRRIMLGTYALSAGYYDAYYKKAMKVRTLIIEEYKKVYQSCDLLLTPTTATTAFKFGERRHNPLEMYLSDLYTVPVNIAGTPAISVPAGLASNGMPIGLQLMGPAFSEATILKAAWAYEDQTRYTDLRAPLQK
ncbi:MAG: Asp-tRNA(Asn)/Glu-tRNA(Gln) amidotransferase subunit GatA [Eubacteriaceae bacterium]|jgi:aspartyl-tRNA(Asn)/glutamyl-tRNA(Gln) amidotransferase subunit A